MAEANELRPRTGKNCLTRTRHLMEGLVFGHTTAQHEIVRQVQMLDGSEGAKTTDALLQASHHRAQGALATLLGLLTLLFSASGVMIELRDALNTIWEIPTPKV